MLVSAKFRRLKHCVVGEVGSTITSTNLPTSPPTCPHIVNGIICSQPFTDFIRIINFNYRTLNKGSYTRHGTVSSLL